MASETTAKHKSRSPEKTRVAVVTISDSKYTYHWTGEKGIETEDVSGREIVSRFEEGGHVVVFYCIIPDHAGMILETIDHISCTFMPDAIITTGGTGIGPRDVTIEAVESVFEKVLDGFGEFFRMESVKEVGDASMLSRATAGLYAGTVVFCLPGSPNASRTGTELIIKEIGHIVKHARDG